MRIAVQHIILILVAAQIAIGGVDGAFEFVIVGLALLDVVAMVLTVVHEASHAAAALVLGFGIREISLGIGPRVLQWRWGPARIKLNLLPVGGHTGVVPRGEGLRWRMILVTAAGPLSHLPLAALLSRLEVPDQTWDILLDLTPQLVIFHMAANLLPIVENDGRNLWRLFTMPEPEIRSLQALGAAMSEIASVLNDPSAGPANQTQRAALLAHLETVDRSDHAARAMALNNLAAIDLLMDDDGVLAEADEASAEAHALLPDQPAITNTRGAVLIMTGRFAEGIELVTATLGKIPPEAVGESHLDLAHAYVETGKVFEARRHLHAIGWRTARPRLLAETLRGLGALEVPVLRRFRDETGGPVEAATKFRREAGAAAATTGEALRAHIQATGEHSDLLEIARRLAPDGG